MNASTTTGKPAVERFFYPVTTVLLLVLTVVGFHYFYFHGKAYPGGRELTPPIRSLVITHGLAMSLWMLLAVAQPFLVAGGNRRVHMLLGKIAVVFALVLVVLGFKVGIASTRVAPPGMMFGPLTPKQFMAVPIVSIVAFACFVAAGIAWRKRPEVHRAMMFMATLTVVGAAIARIDFFNNLYAGTIWQRIFADFFFTDVVGGVILIARTVLLRSFDRWFALAYGVLVAWTVVIAQGAPTAAWDAIATFLLR